MWVGSTRRSVWTPLQIVDPSTPSTAGSLARQTARARLCWLAALSWSLTPRLALPSLPRWVVWGCGVVRWSVFEHWGWGRQLQSARLVVGYKWPPMGMRACYSNGMKLNEAAMFIIFQNDYSQMSDFMVLVLWETQIFIYQPPANAAGLCWAWDCKQHGQKHHQKQQQQQHHSLHCQQHGQKHHQKQQQQQQQHHSLHCQQHGEKHHQKQQQQQQQPTAAITTATTATTTTTAGTTTTTTTTTATATTTTTTRRTRTRTRTTATATRAAAAAATAGSQQLTANSQQEQQHRRGPRGNRARDLLDVGWSWWSWWSWCLCLCLWWWWWWWGGGGGGWF